MPSFDESPPTTDSAPPPASPAATPVPRAGRLSSIAAHLPVLTALLLRWVAVGLGVGLTVSLALLDKRAGFVAKNAMNVKFRNLTLGLIGGSIAVLVLGWLVWLALKPSLAKLESAERWSRRFVPLAWLWPLPLYFDGDVFLKRGLLRLVLAALWAIGLERSLRSAFGAKSPAPAGLSPWLVRLRSAPALRKANALAPHVLVAGATLWFVWFCATFTILQHRRFGTSGFDLGLFDNLFFNLLDGEWFRATVDRGGAGGNHLQYHANFLAYLFLPFYALAPGSETLLVIQAVVVGLAAIPFYLLARHKLESAWGGLVFALLFLFHEAVQSPVFYDFHFLTLGPFFVGWTLYFFETNRKWPLVVAWLLALLLREDQGTVLGAAALVCLLGGKRPLWALVGGLVGGLWLGAMRFWIMPMNAANAFQQHIGIFQGMVAPGTHGFGGVINTLVTNPPFSLQNFLEERKLEYVLALGTPFLLLPFRQARLLLLFVPPALFTLVSVNYPPPVSTRFQYAMYWVPLLIFGSLLVIDDWKKRPDGVVKTRAALVAMLVIGAALSFTGAGMLDAKNFYGGFRKVELEYQPGDLERLARLHDLARSIPDDASITASEAVVPHVSTRRDVFTMRQGAGDSDYLLVKNDEVRGGEQATHLLAGVESGRFGFVREVKDFQLWKKGAPTDRNADALQRLGHRPRPKKDDAE